MTNYVRVEDGAGGPVDPPSFTYSTGTPYETLVSRCDAVLSLAEAAKALAEAAVTLIGVGWDVDRIADAAGAIAAIAREQAESLPEDASPSTGAGR